METSSCGSLASIASPQKIKTTLINVEEIDNGYLISPAKNYVDGFRKVYIQELSQLPNELAEMFGVHDDPAQNS